MSTPTAPSAATTASTAAWGGASSTPAGGAGGLARPLVAHVEAQCPAAVGLERGEGLGPAGGRVDGPAGFGKAGSGGGADARRAAGDEYRARRIAHRAPSCPRRRTSRRLAAVTASARLSSRHERGPP